MTSSPTNHSLEGASNSIHTLSVGLRCYRVGYVHHRWTCLQVVHSLKPDLCPEVGIRHGGLTGRATHGPALNLLRIHSQESLRSKATSMELGTLGQDTFSYPLSSSPLLTISDSSPTESKIRKVSSPIKEIKLEKLDQFSPISNSKAEHRNDVMVGTNTERKSEKREELEKECPACGKSTIVRDYQRSIEICENCGRIIKEEIKDRGPEWRAFNQQDKEEKSRGGPPSTETIHDRGLSTQIDWKNRDSRGKSLSPEKRRKMYRLRKWHKRSRVSNSKDRNLTHAFSEMNRMSSRLGVPKKVQEIASKIYRKAVDEGLIRGRSIEGVASATLYAACRKAEVPRMLEEIADESRVDKREISKSYRFIIRELDIQVPVTDSARYVARFGSVLEISGETKAEAAEIIRKAQAEKLTSGKSPSGTAAAAIYMAALRCGERKTQREVAEAADVTEVTVRNRYSEIAKELNIKIEV